MKKLRDISHVEHTDLVIEAVSEVMEINKEGYNQHNDKMNIV